MRGHPQPDPNQTCSICLEPFADRDPVALTQCFHAFHARCLSEAQAFGRNMAGMCHLCRRSLTSPGGEAIDLSAVD